MTGLERTRHHWWLEHASQAASVAAITAGMLVLCGWTFDLTLLKSTFSGLAAMKANSALGFILAGISLWNASPRARLPLSPIVSEVCAVGVLLLGLLVLAEYLSGRDFGLGQLLIRDVTNLPGDIPGRMAASTAASFTSLGAALILLGGKKGGYMRTIHVLAIGPILVAGAALISYGYDIDSFLRAKLNYTPMAIHTAGVFVLLGIGILSARPDYPFRHIMTSDSPAGSTARRLWPTAIALQLVLGWLIIKGLHGEYVSDAAAVALFAMANIGVFSALVLWNADRLQQVETLRQQAESALHDSERQYRALVENLQEGIWAIDGDDCTTFVNPRMAEMLGYSVAEMQGRHLFSFMDQRAVEIAARNLDRARQGIKEQLEFEFLRKDGTRIVTSLGSSPLYDDQGRYVGALAGITDITARKQLEARLAEASAYTRRLFEVSIDPLVTISLDGKIMDVNEATERATGLERAQLIGSDFADYFTAPEKAREAYRQALKEGVVRDHSLALRHVSGQTMEVAYSATTFKNDAGELQGVLAAARDITARKRMEAERLERERYTRQLLAELPTAVVVHGPDSSIRYGNATALRLLGLTEDQLLGKTAHDPCWHFVRGDGSDMPVEEYPANRVIAEHRPLRDYLLGIVLADGADTQWVYVNAFPDIGSRGELREVIVTFVDISERKRAEEELQALQAQLREEAIRDPLTGLYNRRYLEETLRRELGREAREGRPLSILIGDIDHFKRLNDTYGHQAGDEVLRALGGLLRSRSRTSDIACRYGGEEFVVVLPDMPLEAARKRAEKIRRDFADLHIAFGDIGLDSTVSIGVSAYPSHGTTTDELIGAADQALYEAKQTGRNRVCIASHPGH